jgi:hypothetical protein
MLAALLENEGAALQMLPKSVEERAGSGAFMATQDVEILATVACQQTVGDLVPTGYAPLPQQPGVAAQLGLHQRAGDAQALGGIVHGLVLAFPAHDLATRLARQGAPVNHRAAPRK